MAGMGETEPVRRGAIPAFGLCVVLLYSSTGFSAGPRYHGMRLDDQHRLEVQQQSGVLTIAVLTRARVPEGKNVVPDGEEIWRLSDREVLARVRSEVLIPAGPNYVNNRGQRYRITVQGAGVEPQYVSVKEVDAADARAYLYTEISKLRDRTFGVRRNALSYATAVALAVLNKAGYLPADIPLSVMKSKALGARMDRQTLEHRTIEPKVGPKMDQNSQQDGAGVSGAPRRGDQPGPARK
jgi:hypothetical protein